MKFQISRWFGPGLAAAVAAVLLAGCGGGDDGQASQDGNSQVSQGDNSFSVKSGLAQKGPLRRGSVVTINELSATTLAPNGKSYTFETRDDFGTFVPTSSFGSPLLEVTAQGYFYNELTAETQDWLALRGLSNLAVGADRAVNVNVLTHITKDRIRALVNGTPRLSFAAARAQAQRELLAAFYIRNSADLLSGRTLVPSSFSELDLAQSRQVDQILAVVSSLIAQVGRDGSGISIFLNQIETDLADNGLLDNSPRFAPSVQQQLSAAAVNVDLGRAATNLNNFYKLQTSYRQADLAQWLDRSGGVDQVIERYKFVAETAGANIESRSPAWVAGSDDIGQCFWGSGGRLYKNGVRQSAPTPAVRGDRFTIGITPTVMRQPLSGFIVRSAPDARRGCALAAQAPALRLLKHTVTANSLAQQPVPADYLGANLPDITDYSYTQVYADLVKQARPFGHHDHPWGGTFDLVPVGTDGWPTGDFGLFLMTLKGREPGTYKASFLGKANVNLSASPDTRLANLVYDAANNRTTFDVVRADTPNTEHMVLSFRNTQTTASSPVGSGIKNLKVVRPGYDALNPPLFTNEFINHIARFKVLRFMDWLRTNGNPVVRWSERNRPENRTRSGKGAPWEHVIALANQTGQDIWINIPVGADDDYLLQLARLLKTTLNATSRIYVEYSNELWNSSFTQFHTNRDLATAEVLADRNSPLAYDGSSDANVLAFRRIAKRGKEISDVFRSVYGDAAMMNRVRPVFAGQIVQPSIARHGLDFIDAVYGPPARYFHAFAGAPYFNLGTQQQYDGLTVDAVLQAFSGSVASVARVNSFEENMALARWYGLAFYAYEGGSDTFGGGSIPAKKAASLDPRYLDICKRYLSNWYAEGGEIFMWYTAGAGNWDTQYGTWGLTTDLALTNVPKIQCIDQTLAGLLPRSNARNRAPGSWDALAVAGSFEPFSNGVRTTVRYLHPPSFVDYLVYAPAAGRYQLYITAAAERSGNTVDVSLNSRVVARGFEFRANGWANPIENGPIALDLPSGYSTLRVKTMTENLGYSMTRFTVR